MILSEYWPADIDEALKAVAGLTGGAVLVLLYIRVSREIQVDEGYSLETQAEILRQECAERYPSGCHIIFIADEGVSGGLFWKKSGLRRRDYRRGLTLLVELVDTGLFSAVGVYRCNRFARRARIWLEFKEDHLEPYDVVFFSASDGIDTTQPGTLTMFHILMSGAEHERAQITANCREGFEARREAGYYCGCPPYGWRWQDRRFINADERIDIEPVSEEIDVIRKIVAWYLDGKGQFWIVSELTRTGIPAPAGGSKWWCDVVGKILRNPTNAGLIRSLDGGLLEGRHHHMRIIEPDVYHQVQEKMSRHREKAICKEKAQQDLIFHDMLRCSHCGGRLQCVGKIYYACPGRSRNAQHPSFHLNRKLVESRLERVLLEHAEEIAMGDRAAAKLQADHKIFEDTLKLEQKRLATALSRNHASICLWASRAGSDDYQGTEVEDELRCLADERKRIEVELETNRKDIKHFRYRNTKCEAAAAIARNVRKVWDEASIDEKRELVSHLIDSLVCESTKTGVIIHLNFASGDKLEAHIYVRGRFHKNCGDIWAIGPELLTTAFWLGRGLSIGEVAAVRGIKIRNIAAQVATLKSILGINGLSEILDILGPVIDDRIDELYIDGKMPPKRHG